MLVIDDFVYEHFDEVMTYGNPPSDLRVNCPFCHNNGTTPDDGQHMYISLDKQVVHCFRCGFKSTWIGMVMLLTGYPYHQALAELYHVPKMKNFKRSVERLGYQQVQVTDKADEWASLPEDFQLLVTADNKKGSKIYKQYLIKRGFGYAMWELYNLGYAPESHPGRIIIPIEAGYWQGRSIFKWLDPKYINPKIDASTVIFNSWALENFSEVVICEGAFSAMAVGRNAIALIGKEAPAGKLKRLVQASVDHYILTIEPKAWVTMEKLANALVKAGKHVTLWRFSNGDPADPAGKFEELDYTDRARILMKLDL